MTVAAPPRGCDTPGCKGRHKARGLCQGCYDRERGDGRAGASHRHRWIEQTAKNRATADLRRGHSEEYRASLAWHRAELRRRHPAREPRNCDHPHDLERCPICGRAIGETED